jgi:hypothetical protein
MSLLQKAQSVRTTLDWNAPPFLHQMVEKQAATPTEEIPTVELRPALIA